MKDQTKEMACYLLSEGEFKTDIIAVLAEFFEDAFKEDPAGVGEWLAKNGTSADLFVELVAQLRKDS